MKKFKKILEIASSLLMVALLIALPFYIRSIGIAEANKYGFSKVESVYGKQITYHKEMNEYFNKKIEALINEEGSLENSKEASCDNNVGTFCVAKGASEMFFVYRDELIAAKSSIADELAQLEKEGESITQADILSKYGSKSEGIDREIAEAQTALEMSIEAYNELQIAYPMHVQYLEMMENLDEYGSHLSTIESWTSNYQKLFINATTTQCK